MSLTRNPLAGATYSESVAVTGTGRWTFVSGQVALGGDGKLIDGDVAEQAQVCFDHIERSLRSAGAGLGDVVKITVYLRDLRDYAAFSAVRGARFAGALPASAAVAVPDLLFDAAIEIDAVAFAAGVVDERLLSTRSAP